MVLVGDDAYIVAYYNNICRIRPLVFVGIHSSIVWLVLVALGNRHNMMLEQLTKK